MSDETRDRLIKAARDRDRVELRHLARWDRREVESLLRYEARGELTPGEREYAHRVLEERQ